MAGRRRRKAQPLDVRLLEHQLRTEQGPDRQTIGRIIRQHCRLRHNHPVRCGANEFQGGEDAHSYWKIIYDTKDQADACANALRIAGCERQYSYPCERSKSGHHHLTTSRIPGTTDASG